MKTEKKGDMSIQMVVVAIIALLVLAVVGYIFYDQIGEAAKGYTQAREDFTDEDTIKEKLGQTKLTAGAIKVIASVAIK